MMNQPQQAPLQPSVDKVESGPGPAEQKGAGSPAEIVTAMQQALSQMNESLQGSNLPPEALKHLAIAQSEYDQFTKLVGESVGVEIPGQDQGTPGGSMPSVAGKKGAVPADQPMGKGIRPVPAY